VRISNPRRTPPGSEPIASRNNPCVTDNQREPLGDHQAALSRFGMDGLVSDMHSVLSPGP
jgi:hypothetical protein